MTAGWSPPFGWTRASRALGGVTPRQAAADPTGREQLERLLSEFDHHDERIRQHHVATDDLVGGLITYDTDALRCELGLA